MTRLAFLKNSSWLPPGEQMRLRSWMPPRWLPPGRGYIWHWREAEATIKRILEFVVVQSLSFAQLFETPWTAARQALLFFTISQVCPNSCSLNWWCHPTISSSVIPFSSCPQSLPASGSFPMSRLLVSGGQSIGASVTVLPMNIQCFKVITMKTVWH